MPINPEIPLSGRPAQIAGPMESYAELLKIQQRQQELAIQKMSLGALAEERKAKAQEAQQGVQDVATLDKAYQPGLTREQVIAGVPGHMKATVAKHFDEADAAGLKAQEARTKAEEANTEYFASLAAGVEPWLKAGPDQAMNAARIALDHAKAQGHDVSRIEQHLQQNPDALPQMVDSLIARSPKYAALRQKDEGGGYTLEGDAIRYDRNHQPVAWGPGKTTRPQGKWIADYDPNGKPIERWVEEGPGATAPRQEAAVPPQRPIVVAPGAKAIDPTTGATVAEGNPLAAAKDPALARVDTVNDAGQPVTKFVQPAAGMEVPKPATEVTRPREVKPGSEEAFFIAYAKKLGKRPDDLSLEEQSKARQAWARADDKAASADDVAVNLSSAGVDAAATMYAKTGTLPPMGMGKQGAAVRTKIINRAADMYPGLDLASNKAGFTADQGALTQLQKQRDNIGAFEQTAGKNIDIFLREAGKVVDTGSPIANTAARLVSGKLLGSPDQAAFDAARQVAINEIAKITSGSSSLGGTLSDSARHEISAFNPQNATLKQTVAVMRILKQDMANRTIAMDKQIEDIRGRIKGGAGQVGSAGQAAPPAPTGVFSYQDYLKQKGGK